MKSASEVMHGFALAGNAGTFLVDMFPACKFSILSLLDYVTDSQYTVLSVLYVPSWFPGAEFKIKAAQWHKHADIFKSAPFEEVERSMVSLYLQAYLARF